jgi:hypothetical protein
MKILWISCYTIHCILKGGGEILIVINLTLNIFRLELNGHRRRLSWEATPRSIHDGVQSAIAASDCLVFDTNIAVLFADHGNLGINVTISMC